MNPTIEKRLVSLWWDSLYVDFKSTLIIPFYIIEYAFYDWIYWFPTILKKLNTDGVKAYHYLCGGLAHIVRTVCTKQKDR